MKKIHHKPGYIWRKPHSRRTRSGEVIRIPGMWIKSIRTSHYEWAKKQKASLRRSHAASRKKYGTVSCPRGKIVRVGYLRRSYSRASPYGGKRLISVRRTIVPSSCILDRGLPGKGPRTIKGRLASIGPVRKGTLRKFGYSTNASAETRHKAMRRAIKKYGRNSVMRKVNAIYVWFKNSDKKISNIAKRDKNWISKNYPRRMGSGKASKK